MDWEKEIILAGYRALAKKHHPDAGGNGADFAALGNAKGRLVAVLDYAHGRGFSGADSRLPTSDFRQPRTPQETIDTILDITLELIRPRKRRRRKP